MRLLNERGGGISNFGGMAQYKLKFGTQYEYVPRISFTKYKWIYKLKDYSQRTYFGIRNKLAMIIGKRSFK